MRYNFNIGVEVQGSIWDILSKELKLGNNGMLKI